MIRKNWIIGIKVFMFDVKRNSWLPWDCFINLRDLLLKIWDIYEKCSKYVNFWARKMFFLTGSEFCQKLIGWAAEITGQLLWEIYCGNFERFIKNALTRSIFELEKCSFWKWVRTSQEIDRYHYQGASLAPMCIVWHQTMTKTPTRWSVTSEPSVPPPPPRVN